MTYDLPETADSAGYIDPRNRGSRSRGARRTYPAHGLPLTAYRMDDTLYFTEQHHQVREMVREFARTSVAPIARDLDRNQEFPWENIKAMGELGLLGVPWSEELGGAGMDQISYYVTLHELGKVDASHSLTISAHTNLGTSPIVEFGTEEQRNDSEGHRQGS